jgi:hypothetical protein
VCARWPQARKSVANVLRLLGDAMPPGTLSTQLVMRARYLDWIRDTAFFLRQLPRFGEAFWEVSQVGVWVGVPLLGGPSTCQHTRHMCWMVSERCNGGLQGDPGLH